jgi:putative iron-regulated protein
MTTRRKTWLGIGLFAIAGTTLPTLASAPAVHTTASAPSAAVADVAAERLMLIAQGGEGGEGGDAALPESYALLSTDPNAYQYDAKDEIDAYAAGVHASYVAAAAGVVTLQAAIDALLADPTEETLSAARAAWIAARPAYLVTEAFRFYDGPVEAVEGEINSWPLNEAFIDYVEGKPDAGVINNPDMDLSIATLIVNNQVSDETDVTLGWHAVEFLLWGQDLSADGPGNRPVSDYIAGQGNNDRRRLYLKVATDRLAADLGRLVQAWAPGVPDNYAATFKVLPPREAVGRIMNGVAVLAGFEFMSERLAVGLDSGDQEDEHSCFSDTTHQDFVHDLKGVENVWTGAYPGSPGPGMRDLLTKVDAELAAEVDGLLVEATAKIAALGDPWDQVLASPEGSPERAAGEEAVAALQALADGLRRAGNALGVLVQIPSG